MIDDDREIQLDDFMLNPQLREGVASVKEALREGQLTYADVGGFTDIELDGAYASAVNLLAAGKSVDAIQTCGYLMMIDPYKGRYYQLVGIALQRMKQYQFAEYYYRVGISLDKEDPMSHVYLGECKIMQGQTDDGLELVRKGLEFAGEDPEHGDVVSRGKVLLKQFGA